MQDHQQTIDMLYNSTYCICAQTHKLYLLFFKKMIDNYLSDTSNYKIIVSTTDKLLPQYQNLWPSHNSLMYVSDDLIPTTINNDKTIYIYDKCTKPSLEQQLQLVEFIDTHPNIKYIYVGKIYELTPFTRFKLFRYYLHFQYSTSKWGGIRSGGILSYQKSRIINKKYYAARVKKIEGKTSSMVTHDYYLIHDMYTNKTNAGKFNKQTIKIKKKPVPKNTNPVSTNSNSTTSVPNDKPKIQYIYTQPSNSYLIMPDGSKENYKNLVSKYTEIIEV